MSSIEKIVKKYSRLLLRKKNVVGWSDSFQERIQGGQILPGTKVFRVYVVKKEPLSSLGKKDLVPRTLSVGSNSIETDIVEIGELRSLGTPREAQKRWRPIIAGISAMGVWPESTACTLGGFARNKKKGEPPFLGIIANNHCGAHENKAKKGTEYIQPSPYDHGDPSKDVIGTLWRFVPIKYEKYKCPYRNFFYYFYTLFKDVPMNKVDISLIRLKDDIPFDLRCLNIPKVKGKRSVKVGEKVQGTGRTSGHKVNGTVIDTSFTGRVVMGRGTAIFTDCVLVSGKGYSAGGDSSRPEFTMDGYYYGNLFAGSDVTTVVIKYENIEKELEIEVLW